MNWSNGVPPGRTQVPGPIAALKVSGSQASIMVIGRSSPPAIACVVADDAPVDAESPLLDGEPTVEGGVGADGPRSQLAANAVAASRTSTRRLMSPPVCRVVGACEMQTHRHTRIRAFLARTASATFRKSPLG